MMLSPTAARMGTVWTTLRQIGLTANGRSFRSFSSKTTANNVSAPLVGRKTSTSTTCSNWIHHRRRAAPTKIASSPLSTLATKTATGGPRAAIPVQGADQALFRAGHSCCGGRRSWKSTMASYTESDDEDDDDERVIQYATATAATGALSGNGSLAHQEAWKVNLGRGDNDAWLTGPRNADEWFTGRKPAECPGVDAACGHLRSLPLPRLDNVTRLNAKEYFDNSWTLYETLFAGLNGEEYFYRPPVHGLRHPQIFYYGHTACLYINKLRVAGVLDQPVNAYFESIFEVGVDEMLWDDMHKNDMLWPTVREVHEYRQQVYEAVVDAIETHPSLDESNGPVTVDQSHPMWALFMGFEHERIHLETSSVLFREAPLHLVQTPDHWPPLHISAHSVRDSPNSDPIEGIHYPQNRMIAVTQDTTVDLGKPADFPSYGWDNEYGERTLEVPNFVASEHMITNGEFYQFVKDGGYRKKEYWSDDGWDWRSHRNLKWPFFWEQSGPAGSFEFNYRSMFDVIAMPWDWPVDVTYYEAKAYAKWMTKKEGSPTSRPYRLLTEAEHHVIRHKDHNLEAARKDVSADKVMATSGEDFPQGATGANLNLAFSSQNPVDFFAPSHTGHRDTTGNAWEWTEDHFNPLKGFEVHHVYDDFSTPCFDGKHSIVVGGSFASTGDEASVFARFHFRPHFLQHSGFRLVASDEDAPATHLFAGNFDGQAAARDAAASSGTSSGGDANSDNVYETDESLHMYLGLHYPSSGEAEGVPPILPHDQSPIHGTHFPQRVARLLNSLGPERTTNTALDIGCAVGGTSFELAKSFDHVDAFDFSASFVEAAKKMQAGDRMRFQIPVEAELYEEVEAVLEPGVSPEIASRVNFFTGDACQLDAMARDPSKLAGNTYDGVTMSNLLCRLPDPMACLNGLNGLVNKGGVVVMVTPFSWLTEFTPRPKWLGGFYDPVTKVPIRSKGVLQNVMENRGFEKIHEEEMPLVIREHARKYQYIVSEATGWRKVE